MKKHLLSLLSLLLILSMLVSVLAACKDDPVVEDPDDPTPPADDGITLPPEGTTVSYMPEGFYDDIKALFEEKATDFSCLTATYAPYTVRDSYTFGAGRVHSISIPVYRTMTPDSKGNYTFTIYVFGSTRVELQSKPMQTYEIAINGEEHGLTPNTATFKYITVDLYNYGITLADGQTLAFVGANDTLQAAFLHHDLSKTDDPAMTLYKKDFGNAMCTFSLVGTESLSVGNTKNASMSTLMFDIAIERLYKDLDDYKAYLAEVKAYEDMIATLKEKYAGKTYSVIGDSISTYEGISNNASYHSSMGDNNVYYNDVDENGAYNRAWVFDTWQDTYWGRLTKDIGMELCVNNSWSGSFAYDLRGEAYGTNDFSAFTRVGKLHQDGGTPDDPSDDVMPDVIIVFLGTNDYYHRVKNKDTGNYTPTHYDETLVSKLKTAKNTNNVIDTWLKGSGATVDTTDGYSYAEGIFPYADATGGLKVGTAYTSWQAGYALLMRELQKNYPNAEIVCLTLPEYDYPERAEYAYVMDDFNTCITAIAEYFGATVVTCSNVIPQETGWAYYHDESKLHPSIRGHELLFQEIARSMYAKIKG